MLVWACVSICCLATLFLSLPSDRAPERKQIFTDGYTSVLLALGTPVFTRMTLF